MRGKNTKRRSKTAGSLPSGATRPSVEEEVQASHQEPQLEENAAAAAAVEPLTSHQEEEAAVTHPSTKVTSRGYARAFDKTGSTTVVVMSVFLPAPVKAPHDLSLWNFSHLLDHKAMLKLNNCKSQQGQAPTFDRNPRSSELTCRWQSFACSRRPCTL